MSYLIVGASSGLGRDLAYEFAKNSNNLTLVSRDKKDLEYLKSDIEIKSPYVGGGFGGKITPFVESILVGILQKTDRPVRLQ